MRRNIEVVEDDAGRITAYHRHPNGGGLLGPRVLAEESSYIGATTYVEAAARIGAGCRIGRGGWIDGHAVVGDHVVIGDDVYVGRGAAVGSRARIGSHSRIGAGARIGHGVRLHGDSVVPAGAHIPGPGTAHRQGSVREGKGHHRPDPRMAA
jgi:UDP-3-O-[3-hydroxymyristoyl] glucosamine N-acyltransferase